MNFIFPLLFLFYFFASCNGELYKSIEACVFNSSRIFNASSKIKCAVECNSIDCKGFIFENLVCILYEYREICQCSSLCPNKTIFVNKRYNDEVRTFLLL